MTNCKAACTVVFAMNEQASPANGIEGVHLLRVKDGARQLTLAEKTVRDLIAKGRIRAIRIGKSIRIPADEIARVARDGA